MKLDDLRVLRTGAAGLELSLCGFGYGRDLFHIYLKLGIATVYLSSQRLDLVLAMWREATKTLKGPG